MPEVDLRANPWAQGFPREDFLVERELYRLITIFGSSAEIQAMRTSVDDDKSFYGRNVRQFEFPEISRILLTVAVVVRNEWDVAPHRVEDVLRTWHDQNVGTLVEDLGRPQEAKPLQLRESLNKIIHATTINLERSDNLTFYSGHLVPRLHLYGAKGDKNWKAVLDVYRWAETIDAVL